MYMSYVDECLSDSLSLSNIYIYIYIYTQTYYMCIYIYIYIHNVDECLAKPASQI